MSTSLETCTHGWITPPECPQCCADERDRLMESNALLQAELARAKTWESQLRTQVESYAKLAGDRAGQLSQAKADADLSRKQMIESNGYWDERCERLEDERDAAKADADQWKRQLAQATVDIKHPRCDKPRP